MVFRAVWRQVCEGVEMKVLLREDDGAAGDET
jgi:hypothetical protein